MPVSDATFESVHRRLTQAEAENQQLQAEIEALRAKIAELQPVELAVRAAA